jgi:hypothetical protein
LNAGAAAATGRFLKFLDSDDALNPGHLAAQLASLTSGSPEQVSACRWGYFVDDPSRPAIRAEHVQRHFDDPLEWLVTSLTQDEGMMGGWMWLIPRAVWDRSGGWDERLSLNNDFDFSVRLLLGSAGVRFAPDAVYAYRKSVSGTLSGSRGRKAMESAWLTTEQGTRALLAREDSERIRRICADRFQTWLFEFYPGYPDLVQTTEQRIAELGGSQRQMSGGRLLRVLQPVIGWKGVRQLQESVGRFGWNHLRRWKARQRLAALQETQPDDTVVEFTEPGHQ